MNVVVTHIRISDRLGTDVSSRAGAAHLRASVLRDTSGIDGSAWRVVFDFEGVRTISASFADELFAVIVQECGEVWFREHVGFRNVSEPIRLTIVESIEQRLKAGA